MGVRLLVWRSCRALKGLNRRRCRCQCPCPGLFCCLSWLPYWLRLVSPISIAVVWSSYFTWFALLFLSAFQVSIIWAPLRTSRILITVLYLYSGGFRIWDDRIRVHRMPTLLLTVSAITHNLASLKSLHAVFCWIVPTSLLVSPIGSRSDASCLCNFDSYLND